MVVDPAAGPSHERIRYAAMSEHRMPVVAGPLGN